MIDDRQSLNELAVEYWRAVTTIRRSNTFDDRERHELLLYLEQTFRGARNSIECRTARATVNARR